MTASIDFLTNLVTVMVACTAVSPVVLLGLLVRDWRKGKLW